MVLLLLLCPTGARARHCPSRLPGHLYELHEKFSLGAELRAFYFGVSVGEEMPTSLVNSERTFENNVFFGLKPRMEWYPTSGLNVVMEFELRYRWPGWETYAVPGLQMRPTEVIVEYEKKAFRLIGGFQSFTFGTTALLDQRFWGLMAQYKKRKFSLAIFGGATMRRFMRSANNCLWMSYLSVSTGWKTVSDDMGNGIVGLTFNLKTLKPFHFRALYLYSHPGIEKLRSHALSIHVRGPIVRPYLYFEAEALAFLDHNNYFMPGYVALLRGRFGRSRRAPSMSIGLAGTLRGTSDRRMVPVYENLSWGLIRRYSVFHGNVGFIRAAWPAFKFLKLFSRYYMQSFAFSSEDFSDELDLGVNIKIGGLYDITLAYVGLNLAPGAKPSHAVYLEARIIFGK